LTDGALPTPPLGGFSPRRTHTAEATEFYFPPLRDVGAALPLAAFGALCVVLPLAALHALLVPDAPRAYGLMALMLIGGLAAPFIVCGLAFLGLAIYMAGNSLRVSVDPTRIVAQRRLFGMLVSGRELSAGEIVAIEATIPARFQNAFGRGATYQLVARARRGRRWDVVVAESLRGEDSLARAKQEIEAACGWSASE
jgi:hypothetical protein